MTNPIEDARAALDEYIPSPRTEPEYSHAWRALRDLIAEHERLTVEYERSESARRVALEGVQSDYLSLEEIGEVMSAASDRWDGDEAMHAIVLRFIEHYAALDAAIDSARAADAYDDTKPILFRWDSDRGSLALTAPPSDDERETLAKLTDALRDEFIAWGDEPGDDTDLIIRLRDVVYRLGFRRQGPITDEWEALVKCPTCNDWIEHHGDPEKTLFEHQDEAHS